MFHRFNSEAPEDQSVSVIAMIVSDIKYERISSKKLKWSFWVLQDESSYTTRVTYISDSVENELKLSNLQQAMGTIVFISRMYKENDVFYIDYEDDLAIVALRPNNYQINKFLQVGYSLIQINSKTNNYYEKP